MFFLSCQPHFVHDCFLLSPLSVSNSFALIILRSLFSKTFLLQLVVVFTLNIYCWSVFAFNSRLLFLFQCCKFPCSFFNISKLLHTSSSVKLLNVFGCRKLQSFVYIERTGSTHGDRSIEQKPRECLYASHLLILRRFGKV